MAVKADWVDKDTPGKSAADWTFDASAANAVATQVNSNTSAIAGKGTYTKPGGGIPSSDMATAVQSSLGLADSSVQVVPSDFVLVQFGGGTTRATGYGDFAAGFYIGRAFTATKVIYQFDTADSSGNTVIELRRNGSQVASSNLTISAANQADGTSTDAVRSATINQTFSVGDRVALYVTSVGTTPGRGARAWILGTWD